MPGLGLGLGLSTRRALGGVGPEVPPSASISGSLVVGETLTVIVAGVASIVSYLWERFYEDYSEVAYSTASIVLDAADMGYNMRLTIQYLDSEGNPGTLTIETEDYVRNINFLGFVVVVKTANFLDGFLFDINGINRYKTAIWERSLTGEIWQFVSSSTLNQPPRYTLSTSDLGYRYRLTATYVDGQGYEDTITSEPTGTVNNTPGSINITDGGGGNITTVTVGDQLYASIPIDADGWSFSDTPVYGWQFASFPAGPWTAIAGYGFALNVEPSLAGKYIRFQGSFVDNIGTSELFTSEVFGPVIPPNSPGSVTISGNYRVGSTLTASATDINGIPGPINWVWEVSTNNGPWLAADGFGNEYYPSFSDRGSRFRVTAFYVDGLGANETATSDPVLIPYGEVNLSVEYPIFPGDVVEAIVTTPNGIGGPITFQWWRFDFSLGASQPISGATGQSYTATSADVDKSIFVVVTYTDNLGRQESLYSKLGGVASPTIGGGILTINGQRRVGEYLSATLSNTDGPVDTAFFDWQRSLDGLAWVAVSSGPSSLLLLPSDASGYQYRLVAGYLDQSPGFKTVFATTGAIAPADQPGSASIQGAVSYGNTVEGVVSDPNGVASVQSRYWQRSLDGVSWLTIAGETAAQYLLDDNFLNGQRIRFGATYTDNLGNTSTVLSPASAAIIVPDQPGSLVIQGTLAEYQDLSAVIIDGNNIEGGSESYTWQYTYDSSFAPGSWLALGLTANTITVQPGYSGVYFRAIASYTDLAGYVATVTSAPAGPIVAAGASTRAASVDGIAQVGQALSASAVDTGGIQGSILWRWQVSDSADIGWQTIANSTGQVFAPTIAQGDRLIRAYGLYLDGQGVFREIYSPPTNYVNVLGAAGISGQAKVGQILQGSAGDSYNGIGGPVAGQFEEYDDNAGWVAIAGATAYTYLIPASKVGKLIRYAPYFVDGRGYDEFPVSPAVGPVVA
ncbi:hypothetical protein [Leptolyngbya sp. FACHB-16]|uniref:hypothetical protein n=1 Tax=unclassified Leptolyngbya TaxID=2650499 RepID=UPI0016848BCE|nr:hypothetical protein [Leptolyngbya sp. FACHB-16]MBD2156231.1 hypothetical protein [Leptolyngbya sp. FACHB-16]